MNILYLHPTGTFGGASKSLIELYLASKKAYKIKGWVLTPSGSAAEAFKKAGINVIETSGLTQFDHTRFGYYRNLRWLILLRELFLLPFTLINLLRLRGLGVPFDLIHANEITLLPSGIFAKFVLKIPIIFHVRSLQYTNKGSLRSKFIFKLIKKYSSALICIDETVRLSIPSDVESVVIHNGINMKTKSVKKKLNHSSKFCVGMSGVLHKSKGIYEFLEAANILVNDRGFDVHFLLAGENVREVSGFKRWIYSKLNFSEDVLAISKEYVYKNNLEKHVIFKGLIKDIQIFYPLIDILCFPSHLNACGRSVFEAAFFGIPSIVAIENPPEDAILNGKTGVVISRSNPKLLADAIESLVINREKITLMGEEAKIWANKYYLIKNNSLKVLNLYNKIIELNRLQSVRKPS